MGRFRRRRNSRTRHPGAHHSADLCDHARRPHAALAAGRRSHRLYLAAGALGLPVFAGGASTLALVGPSAGFLLGFLPAAVITSLLKGEARTDSTKGGMLTAARYCGAALVGCVAVDYLFGFIIQSAVTSVSLPVVAVASMGFVFGDVIKAVVASAVAAGLAKLR